MLSGSAGLDSRGRPDNGPLMVYRIPPDGQSCYSCASVRLRVLVKPGENEKCKFFGHIRRWQRDDPLYHDFKSLSPSITNSL